MLLLLLLGVATASDSGWLTEINQGQVINVFDYGSCTDGGKSWFANSERQYMIFNSADPCSKVLRVGIDLAAWTEKDKAFRTDGLEIFMTVEHNGASSGDVDVISYRIYGGGEWRYPATFDSIAVSDFFFGNYTRGGPTDLWSYSGWTEATFLQELSVGLQVQSNTPTDVTLNVWSLGIKVYYTLSTCEPLVPENEGVILDNCPTGGEQDVTKCTFKCAFGYAISGGNTETTCVKTGPDAAAYFPAPTVSCSEHTCAVLLGDASRDVLFCESGGKPSLGDVCVYSCKVGFARDGGDSTSVCTAQALTATYPEPTLSCKACLPGCLECENYAALGVPCSTCGPGGSYTSPFACLACKPGAAPVPSTDFNFDGSNCSCLDGYYDLSGDVECRLCDVNVYCVGVTTCTGADRLNEQCMGTCLPGSFRTAAGTCESCLPNCVNCTEASTCLECGEGTYLSGGDSCSSFCPVNHFVVEGSTECVPCAAAFGEGSLTFTSRPVAKDSCRCTEGYYGYDGGLGGTNCTECDASMYCPGDGYGLPYPAKGFWNSEAPSRIMLPCNNIEACIGGEEIIERAREAAIIALGGSTAPPPDATSGAPPGATTGADPLDPLAGGPPEGYYNVTELSEDWIAGADAVLDFQCENGHKGKLCSSCKVAGDAGTNVTFFLSQRGTCEECPADSSSKFYVGFAFFLLAIVLMIYAVLPQSPPDDEEEIIVMAFDGATKLHSMDYRDVVMEDGQAPPQVQGDIELAFSEGGRCFGPKFKKYFVSVEGGGIKYYGSKLLGDEMLLGNLDIDENAENNGILLQAQGSAEYSKVPMRECSAPECGCERHIGVADKKCWHCDHTYAQHKGSPLGSMRTIKMNYFDEDGKEAVLLLRPAGKPIDDEREAWFKEWVDALVTSREPRPGEFKPVVAKIPCGSLQKGMPVWRRKALSDGQVKEARALFNAHNLTSQLMEVPCSVGSCTCMRFVGSYTTTNAECVQCKHTHKHPPVEIKNMFGRITATVEQDGAAAEAMFRDIDPDPTHAKKRAYSVNHLQLRSVVFAYTDRESHMTDDEYRAAAAACVADLEPETKQASGSFTVPLPEFLRVLDQYLERPAYYVNEESLREIIQNIPGLRKDLGGDGRVPRGVLKNAHRMYINHLHEMEAEAAAISTLGTSSMAALGGRLGADLSLLKTEGVSAWREASRERRIREMVKDLYLCLKPHLEKELVEALIEDETVLAVADLTTYAHKVEESGKQKKLTRKEKKEKKKAEKAAKSEAEPWERFEEHAFMAKINAAQWKFEHLMRRLREQGMRVATRDVVSGVPAGDDTFVYKVYLKRFTLVVASILAEGCDYVKLKRRRDVYLPIQSPENNRISIVKQSAKATIMKVGARRGLEHRGDPLFSTESALGAFLNERSDFNAPVTGLVVQGFMLPEKGRKLLNKQFMKHYNAMEGTPLDASEIAVLLERFEEIDVDGSGHLDVEEFLEAMRPLLGANFTDDALVRMFMDFNHDHGGGGDNLSFEELVEGIGNVVRLKGKTPRAQLLYIFNMFDSSSDGLLGPEEVVQLRKQMAHARRTVGLRGWSTTPSLNCGFDFGNNMIAVSWVKRGGSAHCAVPIDESPNDFWAVQASGAYNQRFADAVEAREQKRKMPGIGIRGGDIITSFTVPGHCTELNSFAGFAEFTDVLSRSPRLAILLFTVLRNRTKTITFAVQLGLQGLTLREVQNVRDKPVEEIRSLHLAEDEALFAEVDARLGQCCEQGNLDRENWLKIAVRLPPRAIESLMGMDSTHDQAVIALTNAAAKNKDVLVEEYLASKKGLLKTYKGKMDENALDYYFKCFIAAGDTGRCDVDQFVYLIETFMMPEAPVLILRKIFRLFDADLQGALTFHEYIEVIAYFVLGSRQERLAYLFDSFDDDHSGRLEYDEVAYFRKIMMQKFAEMGSAGFKQEQVNALIESLVGDDSVCNRFEWMRVVNDKTNAHLNATIMCTLMGVELVTAAPVDSNVKLTKKGKFAFLKRKQQKEDEEEAQKRELDSELGSMRKSMSKKKRESTQVDSADMGAIELQAVEPAKKAEEESTEAEKTEFKSGPRPKKVDGFLKRILTGGPVGSGDADEYLNGLPMPFLQTEYGFLPFLGPDGERLLLEVDEDDACGECGTLVSDVHCDGEKCGKRIVDMRCHCGAALFAGAAIGAAAYGNDVLGISEQKRQKKDDGTSDDEGDRFNEKKKKEEEKKEGEGKIPAKVQPAWKKPATNWDGLKSIASLNISVTFVQISAVIRTMKVPWPKALLDVWGWMPALNFDVQVLAPECVAPVDHFFKWRMLMSAPFFALLAFLLFWVLDVLGVWSACGSIAQLPIKALVFAINKCRGVKDDDDDDEIPEDEPPKKSLLERMQEKAVKYQAGYILFIVTSYVFLAQTALSHFDCTCYEESGTCLLDADPTKHCDYAENNGNGDFKGWRDNLNYAIFGVIVYVAGIPLLLSAFLMKVREQWNGWAWARTRCYRRPDSFWKKMQNPIENPVAFFFVKTYEVDWYLYAVVIMIRKLCFVVITQFFSNPTIQMLLALVTVCVSIGMTTRFFPFKQRKHDVLDLCLMITNAIQLFTGLMFLNKDFVEDTVLSNGITAFAIAISVLAYATMFFFTVTDILAFLGGNFSNFRSAVESIDACCPCLPCCRFFRPVEDSPNIARDRMALGLAQAKINKEQRIMNATMASESGGNGGGADSAAGVAAVSAEGEQVVQNNGASAGAAGSVAAANKNNISTAANAGEQLATAATGEICSKCGEQVRDRLAHEDECKG